MSRHLPSSRLFKPLLVAGLSLLASCAHHADRFYGSLKPGDIVFQDSGSPQCLAIKLATGSPWSHCGIVLEKDGQLQVLEAVQPVCWTPIRLWCARGVGGRVEVTRMLDQNKLSPAVLARMTALGEKWIGKNYDARFLWNDEAIYCSELVWKVFERGAGVELAPLRPMRSYRLADPEVQALMQARYGEAPPLSERMISPEDLRTSAAVTTVGFPRPK